MTIPTILVCDEGPGVGLGHRRRCEVIANELARVGFSPAIVASGRGVIAAPVVVVDSYQFRADDRTHFVPDVVVAIDDLDRDLDVDLLIRPGPGAPPHREHVEGAAPRTFSERVTLAGAAYCLIDASRREIVTAAIDEPVRRILITMGAADAAGIGAEIAADFVACRSSAATPIDVRLVVGPWGADIVPIGVTGVFSPKSLTEELARADIVVTAGGVTLLESLALGRPTIVVVTAENQRANADACVAAGAAIEASVATAAAVGRNLIYDVDARDACASAGRALVDGRGAQRVASAVAQRVASMCVVAS